MCVMNLRAHHVPQPTEQFTPVHRACSQGHGNVLKELLRQRSGRARARGGGAGGGGADDGSGGDFWEGGLARAWGGGGGGGSGNVGERRGTGGGRGKGGSSSSGGGLKREGGGGGGRGGSRSVAAPLPSEVVDIRNHFEATPLHRAAAKGHAEVCSYASVLERTGH